MSNDSAAPLGLISNFFANPALQLRVCSPQAGLTCFAPLALGSRRPTASECWQASKAKSRHRQQIASVKAKGETQAAKSKGDKGNRARPKNRGGRRGGFVKMYYFARRGMLIFIDLERLFRL